MRKSLLLVLAAVLVPPAQVFAQAPGPQAGESMVRLAGGARTFTEGTSERRAVIHAALGGWLTPILGLELELVAGGGRAGTSETTTADGIVSDTDWAGSLNFNVVARTPGRIGLFVSAGPGLYIDQRDLERRRDDDDDAPELLERDVKARFGVQATGGVDVAVARSALFAHLRYEARSVSEPRATGNWQIVFGVRFPAWW